MWARPRGTLGFGHRREPKRHRKAGEQAVKGHPVMTAPRVPVKCVGTKFQLVFDTGKSSLRTVTATALKASPPRRPASPNTFALFPSEILHRLADLFHLPLAPS